MKRDRHTRARKRKGRPPQKDPADYGLFEYQTASGETLHGVRLRIKGRLWQREGLRTKTAARMLRDKVRVEVYENRFFPEKYAAGTQKDTSIEQLLLLVVEDYKRQNQVVADAEQAYAFWTKFKGAFKTSHLTGSLLTRWADEWKHGGLSNGTINRRMSKLLRGFALAREHQPPLVTTIPKWKALREAPARAGFLEWEAFRAIREQLFPYARIPATIGYWTGMRYGEIRDLEWRQVTFDHHAKTVRIHLGGLVTKNGRPRQVIMPGDLYQVLTAWQTETANTPCQWVCQVNGHQIGTLDTGWKSACIRAGLATGQWVKGRGYWKDYQGPIFHDLRRTGLRNLIRAGVDRETAKSISGHRTDAVFGRYNIVNEEDLELAGQKVVAYHTQRFPQAGMTSSMTSPIRHECMASEVYDK